MPDLVLDHERARSPQALVETDRSGNGVIADATAGMWSIPVADPNMMPSDIRTMSQEYSSGDT